MHSYLHPPRCICGDFPSSNVQIVSTFQTFLGVECFDPDPCLFDDLVQDQSSIETFAEILSFLNLDLNLTGAAIEGFVDIAEVGNVDIVG